jgi:hypothetical protein
MWTARLTVGVAALTATMAWLAVPAANAANGPTFRDCSLVGGLDPDFVQLSGVAVGPGGALTVPAGQQQVGVEASESSDPGDNLGHVTLNVTVTSRGVPTQEVSGEGAVKVLLSAPLLKSRKPGRTYTIGWAATFDNGNHVCPSESTPENTTAKPFVITVH